MKLGIGNDQAAYDMKLEIMQYLESLGHEVVDYGAHSAERTDYPTWGRIVAEGVASGEVERGIVICGSGIGISIAANKVRGIRCCVCSEPYSARMSREHNNANMLAFGARVIGVELAKMIVDEWLAAEFQGGRHADRVALIGAIEADYGR